MSKAQGCARQGVQKYDEMDSLDDVEQDATTKLAKGVSQLLKYLKEKGGILERTLANTCGSSRRRPTTI